MRSLALCSLLVVVGAGSVSARPLDLALRTEPAAALPLDGTQGRRFGLGGGGMVKGGLALTRFLDVQVGALFLLLRGSGLTNHEPGGAFALGGGLRLQRPHGRGQFFPWLDADLFYVRTGPLDRFGFAAGVGVTFPVGRARRVWLGPYARYLQIVELPRPGIDDNDAKIMMIGLAVEADFTVETSRPAVGAAK